jgi:hypothetical protein
VTAVPPIRGTTLVAAIAGVIAAATIVTHTHTGKDAAERGSRSLVTTPTVPAAPAHKLTRPVTLRWHKVPRATHYLILRNGVVVLTVTANPSALPSQAATVRIPCTGNTLSTLRVVARNSGGKSSPSKPSTWRC